jgi:hypothetical protein
MSEPDKSIPSMVRTAIFLLLLIITITQQINFFDEAEDAVHDRSVDLDATFKVRLVEVKEHVLMQIYRHWHLLHYLVPLLSRITRSNRWTKLNKVTILQMRNPQGRRNLTSIRN